jgi:hypothetical protein
MKAECGTMLHQQRMSEAGEVEGGLPEETRSLRTGAGNYILYSEFHMLICRMTVIQPCHYCHIYFHLHSFHM